MTKKAKGQGSMGSMVTYQELKKNTEDGTQSRRFGVGLSSPKHAEKSQKRRRAPAAPKMTKLYKQ
jgi:hypothetical protein